MGQLVQLAAYSDFLALIPRTAFGIYNNGATTATVNNP